MTVHEFKTISDTGSSQITIKASKFLGYTWHVTSAEQIGKWLDSIRSQHKKATHHCYAWRLGLSANDFRANDDGEPSGSAGRPILGQIDSKDLTDIFVVVVRYYGGTKLGVPGLISAYKQAAREAIEASTVVVQEIYTSYKLSCGYEVVKKAKRILSSKDVVIFDQQYLEECTFSFKVSLKAENPILNQLNATPHFWQIEKLHDD